MAAARTLYPARAIATLLGLTERRVRQLADEGIIPRPERGKYDLVGSVQGYVKFLREQLAGKETALTKNEDRATIWKARAERERFETDLLLGSVYVKTEADQVVAAAMQVVARHLRGLGGRTCGDLAALSEPATVCDYVDREAHAILDAASRELRRLGADGDNGGRARAAAAANGGRVGGRQAGTPAGLS